MLPSFGLTEPLVTATVTLLSSNLNSTIDSLNATITDGYKVPHAVQFLSFVPVPSTLEGGMPAVGVQRLPAQFEDDLRVSMHARHHWAIVAILQHTDQRTLSWQLERMAQAVANTIQADRVAGTPPGTASVLKTQGGAWATDFEGTEPGPLLGDLDVTDPEAPPRSYLSWTAILLSAKKVEV